MIVLTYTSELDETWSEETGTEQWVVIKVNNIEVDRFKPESHVRGEHISADLTHEVVNYMRSGEDSP